MTTMPRKGANPWAGKTNKLIPGFQYKVKEGPLKDEVVTVVDNTVIRDKDEDGNVEPNRRKIAVLFDGTEAFILPRQLDDKPVSMINVNNEVVTPQHEFEGSLGDLPVVDVRTMKPEDAEMAMLRKAAAEVPLTDPMDPRLDHLRPDRHIADPPKYISRTMKNGMDDITFLLEYASDLSRAENGGYPVPFALKGDTQSGKTLAILVLAIRWAIMMGYPKPMPVFTLSGSAGVTDFQIYGQFVAWVDPLTGKQTVVWLMGIAEMAARAGGIFYVDEINAIAERFTTSMFPLFDWRHEFTNPNKPVLKGGIFMPETIKAHPDFWPTATYNEGYEGMVKLNRAVHQRFDHILWDYSDEVELEVVKSPGVLVIGKAFRAARKARKLSQPIGTSVLQRFVRNIRRFGVEGAQEVFLGMFDERERRAAEDIFKDRTLMEALNEEERQRQVNASKHANIDDAKAAIKAKAQVAGNGKVLEAALDEDPFFASFDGNYRQGKGSW